MCPRAQADAYAAEQLAALLPDGVSTPGHHLWEVWERAAGAGAPVGHVWLAVRDRTGYLVDIELRPGARGRGLGRASMLAVEEAARGLGAEVLRLNVFGHNALARGLYQRLGYDVVSAVLTRVLEPGGHRDCDPSVDSPGRGLHLTRPAQVNPGHERWTASRDGQQVASLCLHWPRRGGPARLEAHHLRATTRSEQAALLRALVELAGERGVETVAVETGDASQWQAAFATAEFALTAELRERSLAGP